MFVLTNRQTMSKQPFQSRSVALKISGRAVPVCELGPPVAKYLNPMLVTGTNIRCMSRMPVLSFHYRPGGRP